MPCTIVIPLPAVPDIIDRLGAEWAPYCVPDTAELVGAWTAPPGGIRTWSRSPDGPQTDVLELPLSLELRAVVRR